MQGTGIQNAFNFTPADSGQLKAFETGVLQNSGPPLDKFKQGDIIKGVQSDDPWSFAITAWGNAIFMAILVSGGRSCNVLLCFFTYVLLTNVY